MNDVIKKIEEFCLKRDWKNDDPNQLLSSIFIELGELAEHYQWTSKFKVLKEDEKVEVSYEFVDVVFYLFRLAGKSGIDLDKAFAEKLKKLEIKYPIGSDLATQHNEYRKTGKNKKYD